MELRAISNLLKALLLMAKAHRKQRDKGGAPYIYHPITVSRKVKGYDEKIVALLHDVFEDSDIKLEDVNFLSEDQVAALKLLTRNPSEGYQNYIENIKENPIAFVKSYFVYVFIKSTSTRL